MLVSAQNTVTKILYFPQVSPFIHFIFLSYALTIYAYDLSCAFLFHSQPKNRKTILLVCDENEPLLVQTIKNTY